MNRRYFLTSLGITVAWLAGAPSAQACRHRRGRPQCATGASPFSPSPIDAAHFDAGSRPSYAALDAKYTLDVHDCPDISPSPNQCAVRMSRALIGAGIPMDSDYPGNLCRHGYARGAQDLGAFLRIKWGTYDYGFTAPGSAPSQIQCKKGVILFANIPGFTGQGHIDLWNGSSTKTGEYWDANPIWFWVLS